MPSYRSIPVFLMILGMIPACDAPLSPIERTIAPEALVAERGSYDVIVLTGSVGEEARQNLDLLLRFQYGDAALRWTVQEVGSLNHVYAYPVTVLGDSVDSRASAFRATAEMINIGARTSLPKCPYCPTTTPKVPTSYVALFDRKNFNGNQLSWSGVIGTSQHIGNLKSYGFNDKASSYQDFNSGTWVRLYDGWDFTSHLADKNASDANFSNRQDNKTSSIRIYF